MATKKTTKPKTTKRSTSAGKAKTKRSTAPKAKRPSRATSTPAVDPAT